MSGHVDPLADARPDTRVDDDRAPVLVSTGEAARLTGVNARTIRRWIDRGYLPSVAGERGALVSPADLPAARDAAERAGGGRPEVVREGVRRAPAGHPDGQAGGQPDTPPGTVTAAARSQLEAIRDEWLAPLVERIGELEREAGRLTAELEHERSRADQAEGAREQLQAQLADRDERLRRLQQERAELGDAGAQPIDALQARVEALEQRQDESPAPAMDAAPGPPQRVWWRFWERR